MGRSPRDDEIDRKLVERYLGGDDAAFIELYNRLRDLTYGMLATSTGPTTAKDLQADVWERIIKNLAGWRPTSSFRSWVVAILLNRLRDHVKKHTEVLVDLQAREREKRKADDAEEPKAAAGVRDPFAYKVITECIRNLAPEQQEVFWRRADESTFAEIAEETGVNLGTTKSRYQLAVAHLQDCLTRRGIWSAS